MPDNSFGPYRLGELLGQGGMGEVHRDYDTRRHRSVALKRLSPGLATAPDFAARFRRESELAARLNNPHIIPIHDFGEVDGTLFIDMRLVEGTDLAQIIAGDGPMAPTRAVEVVSQVAQALDAAHAQGLVHRDVKPSNVLVTRDEPAADGRDFCYLIDFGIARTIEGPGATALTTTGAAIGTVAYIAPERVLAEPADHRVDVYALTCVLYELLTGNQPFAGRDSMAIMYAHVHGPIPRPGQVYPGLPPGLDDVVLRGMAKDPSDRIPNAGALAAAARAALTERSYPLSRAGRPTQPLIRSTDAPRARTVNRRRLLVGTSAFFGLAAASATAIVVWNSLAGDDNRAAKELATTSPTFARMLRRGRAMLGVRDDQPGLGLRRPDGSYIGFDVDIARLIAAKLGFSDEKIDYKTVPSAAREKIISRGEIDYYVGTYTITDERKQSVSFAGPYLTATQGLLVRADESRITGAGTLDGRKVCGVSGSLPLIRIRELRLTEPKNIVELPTYQQCVDLILSSQADTLITDDVILRGYAATSAQAVRVVQDTYGFAPLTEFGIGLAHDDGALRARINAILQAAIDDGTWAKIYASSLGESGSAPPLLRPY